MCLWEEIDVGLPAAAVYEIRSGALQSSDALAILEELKRTAAVIAVIDNGQRRQRLTGHVEIHAAEPAVPKSHTLDRQRSASARERSRAAMRRS